MSVASIGRSLSHRNFRLFFFGQGVSLVGTWMQTVAMTWLVYRLTGSAVLLGVVGFASQAPAFFLAPFAGVWIDRVNRHRLLILTQLLSMVQSFGLAGLTLSGLINEPWLIALSFFQGLINGIDTGQLGYTVLLDAIVLAGVYFADHPDLLTPVYKRRLTLDQVFGDEEEIRADLRERLGLDVREVEILEADYVRDITRVDIRYVGRPPIKPVADDAEEELFDELRSG